MSNPVAIYFADPYNSLQLVGRILAAAGFEVITAYHDKDVFAQITKQPILIIIEDIGTLEEVNHYALLKSNPALHQIPMIIVAQQSPLTQNIVDIFGEDQYIPKPFNSHKFKEIIQQHLVKNGLH